MQYCVGPMCTADDPITGRNDDITVVIQRKVRPLITSGFLIYSARTWRENSSSDGGPTRGKSASENLLRV